LVAQSPARLRHRGKLFRIKIRYDLGVNRINYSVVKWVCVVRGCARLFPEIPFLREPCFKSPPKPSATVTPILRANS
jgi:hypothetical protein